MSESVAQPQLKRAIGLPLLVFYGLGVTVGAGVYALIGEIVGIAGTYAPLAFVVSGLVAATTAVSYSLLTSVFPRAAGEAYFVGQGLGSAIGTAVGWGIVATAVASSATISLAFSNYLSTLLPFAIPQTAVVLTSLVLLAGFACLGVRESLIAAAVITVAEVGVLMYIIALGADYLNPVAGRFYSIVLPDLPGCGFYSGFAASGWTSGTHDVCLRISVVQARPPCFGDRIAGHD